MCFVIVFSFDWWFFWCYFGFVGLVLGFGVAFVLVLVDDFWLLIGLVVGVFVVLMVMWL